MKRKILTVISTYAPQVGCEIEEKENFLSVWDDMADEEVMGRYCVRGRNDETQMMNE